MFLRSRVFPPKTRTEHDYNVPWSVGGTNDISSLPSTQSLMPSQNCEAFKHFPSEAHLENESIVDGISLGFYMTFFGTIFFCFRRKIKELSG